MTDKAPEVAPHTGDAIDAPADEHTQKDGTRKYTLKAGLEHNEVIGGTLHVRSGGDQVSLTPEQYEAFKDKFIDPAKEVELAKNQEELDKLADETATQVTGAPLQPGGQESVDAEPTRASIPAQQDAPLNSPNPGAGEGAKPAAPAAVVNDPKPTGGGKQS